MTAGYLAQVPRVLARVFRNRELRRVQLAFVVFNGAEWGVWIAMLVYAYERGGATTAGLVAFAQLVPAGLFAPFAAVLADRYPPARVLTLGYGVQALAMGATAVALLADARPLLVITLAAVAATAVTITRPTQAALVPALARSPDELTASNVVSGWIESVSLLFAPAATGVILAVSEPGTVFAVMAAACLVGLLLVAPVAGPPAAGRAAGSEHVLAEAVAGFSALKDEPAPRLLVALLGAQFVAIGALDVLFVVLAIGVLGHGAEWAGYLNAAFGAGGVVALAATVALVGRRRLLPPLLLAVAAWALAFVVLGVAPSTAAALVLLGVAGASRSLVDIAARTLLQRTGHSDVLGRLFGVVEGLTMAGLAVGSLLAPLLIALGGPRTALLGLAAILPLPVVLAARRLRQLDASATVPVVQVALLRSHPIFAPIGCPAIEKLALDLEPIAVAAGTAVVRAGDVGDRFYVVADGELDVFGGSVMHRGDGFGEIALLFDVPRTATVVARTAAHLYALERNDFLAALGAHPDSARAAERIARARLERTTRAATLAP